MWRGNDGFMAVGVAPVREVRRSGATPYPENRQSRPPSLTGMWTTIALCSRHPETQKPYRTDWLSKTCLSATRHSRRRPVLGVRPAHLRPPTSPVAVGDQADHETGTRYVCGARPSGMSRIEEARKPPVAAVGHWGLRRLRLMRRPAGDKPRMHRIPIASVRQSGECRTESEARTRANPVGAKRWTSRNSGMVSVSL
jgi:hypothetical protein